MPDTVKQKFIQPKRAVGQALVFSAALWCLGTSTDQAAAQSLSGLSGDRVANLRLIAANGMRDGAYQAAVVITMASGSHTYWRSPGDAGVPPLMTTTGSTNLLKADLLFPAPTRISEEGLDAYGYIDQVVLPVRVVPTDPREPTQLHLEMSYAVCSTICVPARSTANLTLPAEASPVDAVQTGSAFALLPKPLPVNEQQRLQITAGPRAAKQSWSLEWRGEEPLRDIFAEAPEGFAFATKKTGSPNHWTLVASQADSAGGVPVSLTLVGEIRSNVTIRTLDVRAPNP